MCWTSVRNFGLDAWPSLTLKLMAGAPRLPGFHACVGGGGDKQEASWYKDHGTSSPDCKQVNLSFL